jgi:hypothetical protein
MDEILPEKDAFSSQTLWAGDTFVVRQGKSQRPICRFVDSNARRDHSLGPGKPIVPNLQRRAGIGQVEAIVGGPREPKCLAETAWA